MNIYLRPHHLLCIQKFTGHGYDQRFTAHMMGLVWKLKDAPETLIEVTEGCDELCRACPNNEDGKCSTLEKVDQMDRGVLDVLGHAYGRTALWAELARSARERVLQTEKFEKICAGCQWFQLCKDTAAGLIDQEREI